jgi:beta-galactosidase
MQREPYPHHWQHRQRYVGAPTEFEPVTVPHDAVLGSERVDDSAHQSAGYFPGGAWEYHTRFAAPDEWRNQHVVLEFEAIHRSAAVFVNDELAVRQPSGTSAVVVELDSYVRHGGDNEIVVEARSSRDARWYTGGGIIRPVQLAIGPRVHVPLDGIVVTTPEHDAVSALVQVVTTVRNLESVPAVRRLETSIVGPSGALVGVDITRVSIPAGGVADVSQRILVMSPRRWSVDTPDLYRVDARLIDTADADAVDLSHVQFGIRSLHLDAARGLRINGVPVKLRGACVHADNGVIGAATFDHADERRVAILKSAGFNAIRSAHQPMSRAMLEACDRLGMLVMDELTDVWTKSKSPEDGADHFLEQWQHDLEAMVVKDRNHPSVIIYSIGNEIPEAATRGGSELSRSMTAATRRLDPTRYVTAAVNGSLFVMDGAAEIDEELFGGASRDPVVEINGRTMSLEAKMSALAITDAVTELTEEAYGAPDIAGMNYQDSRYELDRERFPNRVIVGSESFPTHIDRLWALVNANPHVIGDFTWTGWDYLGEPGLGRMHYREDPPGGALGSFPFLISGAGDIDITGERRPASYYREIVFGRRTAPYIAVRRPHTRGKTMKSAPWSWTDSISSWTWSDVGSAPMEVEVYSDAAEVELVVGGRSLGRLPTGPDHRYRAVFVVEYAPGRIEAIAIRGGVGAERTELRSADDERRLTLCAERDELAGNGQDLGYVVVEVVDSAGIRATDVGLEVQLTIDGPGVLQGFGNAAFSTEESFTDARHSLHDGRALAVIRPSAPGLITVTATAPGFPPASVGLTAT